MLKLPFFGGSDRNIARYCGHKAKRVGRVSRFGARVTTTQKRGADGRFDFCHECLAGMVIRCAWCKCPIFVGHAITLYTPADPNYQVPEHATVFSWKPLRLVGCQSSDCAEAAMDYRGPWVPAKEQVNGRWVGGVADETNIIFRSRVLNYTEPEYPIVPERFALTSE